jgi:hypothetical protein
MSCELTVTNVRVINDCQCGVCGVGSSDCDSWVVDPAWEDDAVVVTKAAEQQYFKCLKTNGKVEDCDDSSMEDTLSFDCISPPCLDCSSGESTVDDGETTADDGVAGLQQRTEASSNTAVQQRLAPAAVANDLAPVLQQRTEDSSHVAEQQRLAPAAKAVYLVSSSDSGSESDDLLPKRKVMESSYARNDTRELLDSSSDSARRLRVDSTESESQGSASSPVPTFDLKMHPAVARPDYEVSQHDCTPKRLSVKASNFDTDTTGARRSLKTSSSDSEETAAIQSKSPAYSSSGESTVDDAIVEFRRSLMKTSSSESDETRDLLGESTVNAGQAVAQQHNVGSPRVAQQERVELLSSPDVDGELPSRKRQRTCRFIDDHAGASSGSCGSDEIDDDIVDENGYARDSFIASSEDSLEL